MNILDIILNVYGGIINVKWIPKKFISLLRLFIRFISALVLPKYLRFSHRPKSKKNVNVIVSFTSFPTRIDSVWQVVECMLRQTYCPQRIILWLSEEQFKKEEDIPITLRDRVGDVFQIRLVSGDIRSHKKYYYVVQEYPNSLILLIDDDLYYPSNMIEQLINVRENENGAVICRYGYEMKYDNGIIKPYSTWDRVITNFSSACLFFGSGGGTLFNPSQMYKDLTNIDLALKMTPMADDVWLNAMLRIEGSPLRMLKQKALLPIKIVGSNQTLCSENVYGGRNDQQIANVRTYYMAKLNMDPFAEDILKEGNR